MVVLRFCCLSILALGMVLEFDIGIGIAIGIGIGIDIGTGIGIGIDIGTGISALTSALALTLEFGVLHPHLLWQTHVVYRHEFDGGVGKY
ncbi:hypothetical protein ACFX12_039778 [Malus domestica]